MKFFYAMAILWVLIIGTVFALERSIVHERHGCDCGQICERGPKCGLRDCPHGR